MGIPFDYETLRVIWWLLLGVLLIGFALTDGFDLGSMALLPFIGKTDEERRMVINSVGATWEGNQVWFILGGGAIFAAWPFVYAVSFSGFYLAMFLVLSALILRPVGFKYRSKRPDAAWRARWDWALFVGGFVPALIEERASCSSSSTLCSCDRLLALHRPRCRLQGLGGDARVSHVHRPRRALR